MGYYLGEIFFDNCVNMNGAPRMRTPSRRSGARSCHAPGGMAARGPPPVGVLRSAAHRRAESRSFGAFSSSPYTVPLCWVWGPGIAVLCSCQRGWLDV